MKLPFTEKGTLLKEFGKMPIRHSSALIKLAVGYSSLEFRVEVWARILIWALFMADI